MVFYFPLSKQFDQLFHPFFMSSKFQFLFQSTSKEHRLNICSNVTNVTQAKVLFEDYDEKTSTIEEIVCNLLLIMM